MPKHLFPTNTSTSEQFQMPPSGGGGFRTPERDRYEHGRSLLASLAEVSQKIEQRPENERGAGVYLEFRGEPGSELAIDRIESVRDGRELVAVRIEKEDERDIVAATVLVDPRKLDKLAAKVEDYLTKGTRRNPEKPQNKDLVESVSSIWFAPLHSLYVGSERNVRVNEVRGWEIWLRAGSSEAERDEIVETLRGIARENHLFAGEKVIKFPEASVIFLSATFDQINRLIFPANIISELRLAVTTAEFFLNDLNRREQVDWDDDAAGRVSVAQGDIPAVCLLDTGVNRQHPLIIRALSGADMHTYDPAWLRTDHHSHGTWMAGLCLYGDLTDVLQTVGTIDLRHRLESVKMLPPAGENPRDLYGSITRECVARAEIEAPQRKRVICMAVASPLDRNMGMPSSWSAEIDRLAAGADEENDVQRLFFIAAGNADQNNYAHYPASNHTDQIHDPAQSWNALTVGAHTEKVEIPAGSRYVGCPVLAPVRRLSPHSTTSMAWKDMWPIKPDIVMEGGNLAHYAGAIQQIEPLRLLTTHKDWALGRPFADCGETSAATALASRYGAAILAEYPDLWPETVRGLLVHSAEWTEEMLAEFGGDHNGLVRCYGHGVPDLGRALESARNSLTLVVQDSLQPFRDDNGYRRLNEMHLHELPWARDVLLDLGEVSAKMRVTLSYFIEPNPSSRGFTSKHRYASHQLNFTTIKSDEGREEFRSRINLAAREGLGVHRNNQGDSAGWFLKHKLRSKGSIHSDTWTGTAADLAAKNTIAVYPVGGWWKDLKRQRKWDSIARYSLIVSIETEAVGIDLYNIIRNEIEVAAAIEIEN